MTYIEITEIIRNLRPTERVSPMEVMVGFAVARAEQERCIKIAEMPGMTPADIARAIRNG